MSTHEPTDEEFRQAGFTGAARRYPLSEAGKNWICRFNGITRQIMPRAWGYAPNPYMLEYIESRAKGIEAMSDGCEPPD